MDMYLSFYIKLNRSRQVLNPSGTVRPDLKRARSSLSWTSGLRALEVYEFGSFLGSSKAH